MEAKLTDRTAEFLNDVYKNAKMGMNSLSMLIDKTDDADMRRELQKELEKYTVFATKVTDELARMGKTPEEIGILQNVGLWAGVTVNALIDSTPSHIAQMIIEGSNMGIVELTKILNNAQNVDASAQKIALELMHMEEYRVQKMKRRLK